LFYASHHVVKLGDVGQRETDLQEPLQQQINVLYLWLAIAFFILQGQRLAHRNVRFRRSLRVERLMGFHMDS